MTRDRELKYDVRQTLLENYTNQATSHATGFLAMAVIGLTLVQLGLQKTVLIPTLSTTLAVFFRMMMTTFYWGYMAEAIIRVRRDLGELEMKEHPMPDGERHATDAGLETLVLHSAAARWVRLYRWPFAEFRSFAPWRGWVYTVLVGTAAFTFLRFL